MDEITREMIDDHLGCACSEGFKSKILPEMNNIDLLFENLPGINYVKNSMVNYVFSNGLTCGSINGDEVLDRWLYSMNKQGATNYSVLRDVWGDVAIYGECGLRWVDGFLYQIQSTHYRALTQVTNGIEEVIAYYMREDGKVVDDDIDLADLPSVYTLNEYMKMNGYILLDKSEFVNVRNDTSKLHGQSPIELDQLRIKLLIQVYERLNYDIAYDGPGRIVIRPKDGFSQSEDGNEMGTTNLLNTTGSAEKARNVKAQEEAKRVAGEIKRSGSDAVIVLSNAFDKEITHLERVTKATEFFEWLENEGTILAQDLGMSPSLLELGRLTGNVSMEKIIDNSMINSIVPMREQYAIQFSDLIVSHLQDENIKKVYFNKYEMQQTKDAVSTREQVANTIQKLGLASGYMANGNLPREEVGKTINSLAEQMQQSMYDENNTLVDL